MSIELICPDKLGDRSRGNTSGFCPTLFYEGSNDEWFDFIEWKTVILYSDGGKFGRSLPIHFNYISIFLFDKKFL